VLGAGAEVTQGVVLASGQLVFGQEELDLGGRRAAPEPGIGSFRSPR
jgi:hypothetical protein